MRRVNRIGLGLMLFGVIFAATQFLWYIGLLFGIVGFYLLYLEL